MDEPMEPRASALPGDYDPKSPYYMREDDWTEADRQRYQEIGHDAWMEELKQKNLLRFKGRTGRERR